MSFDLTFWQQEPPPTSEEAFDVWQRLVGGEQGVVPPSPAVDAFYEDVAARYGDIDDDTELDELETMPWSSSIERRPHYVTAVISYSRADELAPVLRELAGKHGLLTFDPQERQVHHPGAG